MGQVAANADNQLGGSYDGNGNPTGGGFTFDVENRATSIGSLSETWGANGLRASEGDTYFLYDGSVPVCELSSAGSVTATNTFGASGLVSRHTSSGSVFYTFDPMGNVAQRYTSTGSLVSSDLYDSFGSGTSTAAPSDPFGYEGRFGYYSEHGASLILCGHRFYDTGAGRFLNRDPIGYAGGINLYGYVGNNAVNEADPSGFAACSGEESTDPDNKNFGSNSSGSRTPDDGTGLDDWDADDPGSMIVPLIKMALEDPDDQIPVGGEETIGGGDYPDFPSFYDPDSDPGPQPPYRVTGPGDVTFYHYSNSPPSSFTNGLWPGTSATDESGLHPVTASQTLGIPEPTYEYPVTVVPDQTTVIFEGPVQDTSRYTGGGADYNFPSGTPPGSVGPPKAL